MAKLKYVPESFPLLAEQYARQGLNDVQIARSLGVSPATYYTYLEKFPEFLEAIKKGKAPIDLQVENAALKSALGFEYIETTTEYEKGIDQEGRPTMVPVKSKKVTKYYPPTPTSFIYWLNNRQPGRWKNVQDVNVHHDMKSIHELVKEMAEDVEILEETNDDGGGDQ